MTAYTCRTFVCRETPRNLANTRKYPGNGFIRKGGCLSGNQTEPNEISRGSITPSAKYHLRARLNITVRSRMNSLLHSAIEFITRNLGAWGHLGYSGCLGYLDICGASLYRWQKLSPSIRESKRIHWSESILKNRFHLPRSRKSANMLLDVLALLFCVLLIDSEKISACRRTARGKQTSIPIGSRILEPLLIKKVESKESIVQSVNEGLESACRGQGYPSNHRPSILRMILRMSYPWCRTASIEGQESSPSLP